MTNHPTHSSLTQSQRVLCILLLPRRLRHRIREPRSRILNSSASSFSGVAEDARSAFYCVTEDVADAADYVELLGRMH